MLFFIKDIFIISSASLKPFFSILPWLLLIYIPALTMRALSEEKKTNTLELLLTLPISESQIVLSKFFALLTLTILGFFLTFFLPISLSFLTKIYLPEIIIGYLGLIFISSLFISLSLFFSSLTKNQIVAFLFSTITIFILLVISSDFLASVLPKIIQNNLIFLSPLYHLDNFIKGIVDFRSIFYFISFSLVFLFLTIIDLEKRD